MTQTFYHCIGCNATRVDFNGRVVLYSIPSTKEILGSEWSSVFSPMQLINVAGYVVGEYAKNVPDSNVPVTEVDPIIDANEKRVLTDWLSRRENTGIERKVHIDFWR